MAESPIVMRTREGFLRRRVTVESVDALLPQTQCRRCGYAGCRPYAEAIAAGEADINRCPPGGEDGVRRLARHLGVAPKPLDPSCGTPIAPAVAVIDEAACIGCAQCLAPCPVDAIIGAPKQMHTVVADWCTGCELCIPACPVDCIALRPLPTAVGESKWQQRRRERRAAAASRARYTFHLFRLEREAQEQATMRARWTSAPAAPTTAADPKRATIQAALERAKSRQIAASHGEGSASSPAASE